MATEVSEDDQVIVCDDGVTVATIFPVPPTAKDKDVGLSDMTVDEPPWVTVTWHVAVAPI